MKKTLALLLALTMLVSFAACGKADTDGGEQKTTAGDTTTTTVADDPTTTDSDATTTTGDAVTDDTSTTVAGDPTTTTTAPTTEEGASIRILAIGDGLAVDAMEKHLYDMLKNGGYSNVQLGILYADKSTVDTHYNAVKADSKTYEFRQNTSGKWQKETKIAPSQALKAAAWDYIVLQQSAANAGKEDTYGNLSKLTDLVQKQCPNATLKWHMTWAFQQGSKQDGFREYYNNQQLMFQSIVSTTLKKVMGDPNIMGLIPTGTTIQNLRTSTLRDTLNTDGMHLVDTYGDYAAALTWFCSLTDSTPADTTYRPSSVTAHASEIVEAVENALSIPNQITPAAKGDGVERSISILAVGNSFSVDAMTNHLYQVLEAAGYDNIRLGILYVGGCSIDMHYSYLKNDSASYEYMENTTGKWVNTKNYKASDAFKLTNWDYVTIQQVSGQSGRPDTYGNLDAVIDLIKPQIGKAKLYWQMTWAYQQDSTHGDFVHYGKDQMTMYNAIVSTVKEKILTHDKIDGVIPSGTAIQNLRTSSLGDTLTADGYHLENTIGDYTAALTWFVTLTGNDPFSMFYYPAGAVEHFYDIAEAVENAVAKPWQVTPATQA